MTRIPREQLKQRLIDASRYRLSPETRSAHMAAIEAALTVSVVPLAPSPAPARWLPVRRWVAAVAAAAMSLTPIGVAVAAENALPGDRLYRAKLATESIRSVVDPLVSARHRVEELETLIRLEADSGLIMAALSAAWDSVGSLPADHLLRYRLEELQMQVVLAGAVGDSDTDDDLTPQQDGLVPVIVDDEYEDDTSEPDDEPDDEIEAVPADDDEASEADTEADTIEPEGDADDEQSGSVGSFSRNDDDVSGASFYGAAGDDASSAGEG